MDMKLDPNLIRQLRESRAWSQGHLAEVAGLSLRTIQRIEKNGIASYESAQALAATFETSLKHLNQKPNTAATAPHWTRRIMTKALGAVAASILTLSVIFSFSSAHAQQVKLDIQFREGDNDPVEFSMVNPSGEASAFNISEKYRLEVTPTSDNDGLFLMSVKFYKNHAGEFQLKSRPKVLVKDQEGAQLIFEDENKEELTLWITPSLSS